MGSLVKCGIGTVETPEGGHTLAALSPLAVPMRRLLPAVVAAVLLPTLATPTSVAAQSGAQSRTWTACGGFSVFSLVCAAVRLTVDGTTTSIAVQNLSGSSDLSIWGGLLPVPSAGRWVITKVGFDNAPVAVSSTATEETEGPWYSRTATPRSWTRFDDRQFGGGERIDIGITNGTGISGGIASSCAPLGTLPGGSNRLWMTPNPDCTQYGVSVPDADPWFETDILTTTAWNPNASNVTMYFKAQNGPGGTSYECLVGGATGRGGCFQVDTPERFLDTPIGPGGQVVPEPGTLVMLATGVAGVGAVAWRRRRAAEQPGE
jgi:hypothetical protein